MSVLSETEEAVRASSTKLEVVMRLREPAKLINSRLWRSPVRDLWMSLPPDGAFSVDMPRRPDRRRPTKYVRSGKFVGVGAKCASSTGAPRTPLIEGDLTATVAEAAADFPLRANRSARWNTIRLLWSLYNVTGTLDWGRGWTEAFLAAFAAAGAKPPSPASLRWFRTRMQDFPWEFAAHCPDPALLEDLTDLATR